MIKEVTQYPAEVLHKIAEPISNFGERELKSLIRDMKDTLKNEDGAGIAAPQIGIAKCVFVIPKRYAPKIRIWHDISTWLRPVRQTVFINPRITYYSKGRGEIDEGCLSVRGKFYPTTRVKKVILRAQNIKGKRFKVRAEGLLARIFQHETDHLNGILFLDRLHEK
ncbi:MAG: peptide deformylase [Candidatus Spechtbacteria bacterium]|nr:peptide deformylase [Candidatus Spechtbacteria bacterium]